MELFWFLAFFLYQPLPELLVDQAVLLLFSVVSLGSYQLPHRMAAALSAVRRQGP